MTRANADIKEYARQRKVFLWEVAVKMGIWDTALTRRMRSEFSPEERERVIKLIDEIAAERS